MNILLLIIIVFLLGVIFYPLYKRKYNKIKLINFESFLLIKDKLLEKGILMLNSNKTFMSFNDEISLYTFLAVIKGVLSGNKSHNKYAYYNFPKAFLILGLIDEYKKLKNKLLLSSIINKVDEKYLNSEGELKFKFDKIDQVLFGLVFLELYKITSENKYKLATDLIYNKIQLFKNQNGLYLYRKNDNILFIDSLGMVVPFLIEYGSYFKKEDILKEGIFQIKEYTRLTTKTFNEFPPHAFDLNHDIKLGSNNWSRGIGWYMIGLSYAAKKDRELIALFNLYYQKLEQIAVNNYWPQFFSHSNDNSIDASATIMIYYAASVLDINVSSKIYLALKDSKSKDYFVVKNSGDTIYINRYAYNKSKSELSQGLLISILSKN